MATLLGIADAAAVTAACAVAWLIRHHTFAEPWPARWEQFFKQPLILFVLPIALSVLFFSGLYRPRRDKSLWGEAGSLLRASLIILVLLVVSLWAVGSTFLTPPPVRPPGPWQPGWRLAADPARFQLACLAALLPALLIAQRAAFRLGLRALRQRGWNLRHVLIVGDGRLGQITARTLERNSWTGINPAFFLSHHAEPRRHTCLGRPVLGGLADLETVLDTRAVDAVYLALPGPQAGEVPALLKRLQRFAVDVRIVPDVHPRYLPQSMQVSELEGMPILSYRESPLYGLGGFSKRALDVAGATLAILLFSPLMLAIALAIRLSGPGPVIFRQRRVSLGGGVFNIYKFRTMHHATDESHRPTDAASWTTRDDPRVTRVGRLLRRTSLDELPQLFNVLAGSMSLVGPRPERPELIERFRDDWRGYMLRQHVKAGMTGWAQVHGLRGQTSLKKRVQYDLFYIRHWSIGLDIRILFETLFRGFLHPNAH
jgi:Undecaprenyl-phosphate glucose phosphotransferase